MPHSPGLDLTNLLLGLAWLGELDRRQIQRLWFVDKSESTVEKTLARLHKDGLLAKRAWSIRDEQRNVTVPQLARWSLTPEGHRIVKASDQYPAKPAQVRQQRLIPHDARTTEAIVRLIEIGRRSKLSGLFVAHELPLSPQQKRPICDALVVMQVGTFDQPNLVPWSSDPAIEDEARFRFAIEADNDTEPLAVIAGKASAYRRLDEDDAWAAWWARQYGRLPMVLWVAPTRARATAIHNQWNRAWPDGQWLLTSDGELQRNEVLLRHGRKDKEIALHFHPRHAKLQTAAQLTVQQPHGVVPALPASPTTPAVMNSSPAPAPAAPAQSIIVSTPPPAVIAPVPSPQPSPVLSPASAAPRRRLEPGSTLPGCEAPPSQHRERSIWVELAWDVLCWAASLLWAALRWVALLLWAALKLPWRVLGTLLRWCEGLDYELAANLRLVVFTLALVTGGAMLVMDPPGWLADRMPATPSLTVDAENDAPAWPAPEGFPPVPSCPAVRVTAVRLNLRTEPDLQATALGKLQAGETPTVLYCENDQVADGYTWWQVAGEDGQEGWAATPWLEEIRTLP